MPIPKSPEEIIKEFDDKYKSVWNSKVNAFVRIPDGIKGNMLKDIRQSMASLLYWALNEARPHSLINEFNQFAVDTYQDNLAALADKIAKE